MTPDCKSFWPLSALFWALGAQAQEFTRSIRGMVQDQDAQLPLMVLNTNPLLGTTTDADGYFKMERVSIGRIDLQVSVRKITFSPLKKEL